MNTTQLQKDEVILLGAIKRLLRDRAFLVALVLLIGAVAVTLIPTLATSQQALETILALTLIVLVPGLKLEDIVNAFSDNRGTLIAKFEALLAALAANTAATSANSAVTSTNTVITSNSTQAVLNAAPLASLAPSEQPATRQDVRDAVAEAITAPVPARDTGYVQPKSPVQSTPVVGVGTPDAAPGSVG